MTESGRKRRVIAAYLAIGLLLVGTFWGLDDHFPFGPFRMYSTKDEVDGPVRSLLFEGAYEDGAPFTIGSSSLGLRRAEADGQVERVREDPEFLRHFVEAYEAFHPDEPPLHHFRLFHRVYELRDREPVGTEDVTVAEWSRE
jgi:hypothetical protein